jgi:hypothetical protein
MAWKTSNFCNQLLEILKSLYVFTLSNWFVLVNYWTINSWDTIGFFTIISSFNIPSFLCNKPRSKSFIVRYVLQKHLNSKWRLSSFHEFISTKLHAQGCTNLLEPYQQNILIFYMGPSIVGVSKMNVLQTIEWTPLIRHVFKT